MSETEPLVLYGFNIIKDVFHHKYCIDTHCLERGSVGHRACINNRLASYLTKQYKSENTSSDWELLSKALKSSESFTDGSLLHKFSTKDFYRLRYLIHRDLSKNFIIELLKNHCSLAWQWDSKLEQKINKYKEKFLRLCNETEKSSCGDIYRLYDIINGRNRDTVNNAQAFLSLIFAFGYFFPTLDDGFSDYNHFPKSIRELVARYEFFYEFAKEKISFIKKATYNLFSLLEKTKYLAQSISCIVKLWNYYAQVSTNIFSVDKHAILNHPALIALYDSQKPQLFNESQLKENLRAVFTQSIHQKRISLPFENLNRTPVPFSTDFDAVYHPFKHENASAAYFHGEKIPVKDIESMSNEDLQKYASGTTMDYLQMIKGIISTGESLKARPDQFTPGIVFAYEKKQEVKGKKISHSVFIKCYPNGVSYLLTCY